MRWGSIQKGILDYHLLISEWQRCLYSSPWLRLGLLISICTGGADRILEWLVKWNLVRLCDHAAGAWYLSDAHSGTATCFTRNIGSQWSMNIITFIVHQIHNNLGWKLITKSLKGWTSIYIKTINKITISWKFCHTQNLTAKCPPPCPVATASVYSGFKPLTQNIKIPHTGDTNSLDRCG